VLNSLEAPWREVLLLGWEAYEAGTIPVGAVVVDETGAVVARGRNRIFDGAFDGQLAGSRLAHAEVNALSQLPASGTYEALTLYSLLEPCHLCMGAAHAVRIGIVRYAAADPWGGAAGRLVPSEDHRFHPLAVEGPLEHELAGIGELLLVAHFLWRVPDSNVASFYRRTRPELVEAAQALPAPGSGRRLEDALSGFH
jgi:tRNA(Arg) A34 adenosine deaminase TadA